MSKNEFAKWLDNEMKSRRLSNRDVERVSGLSHSQVGNIRSGRSPAGYEAVVRLAQAFDADLDYLLRLAGL